MAYAKGEVVKQGHADYCEAHGCAVYTVGGVVQERCARCGEVRRVSGEAGSAQPGHGEDWFLDVGFLL